jgi:hypothetical protein
MQIGPVQSNCFARETFSGSLIDRITRSFGCLCGSIKQEIPTFKQISLIPASPAFFEAGPDAKGGCSIHANPFSGVADEVSAVTAVPGLAKRSKNFHDSASMVV